VPLLIKVRRYSRSLKSKFQDIFNVLNVETADVLLSSDAGGFQGVCLDIGAQRSVVGRKQAMAYCRKLGKKFHPKQSKFAFRFGNEVFASLGTIPVRIPTPDGSFLGLDMDVVEANIPMLVGLDVLDREKLVADNVQNKLVAKHRGWSLPITRKLGHMYVEWDFSSALYTKSELQKFHRHFYHPSVNKLFNLIGRAKPEDATPETRKLLEDISKACATCQRFTPKPQSFQVSVPKGIVFNQDLALDLMFLDSMAVLHVVDTQTHFSSAIFLQGQSVEDIWYAFLECWVTLYSGYPDVIKVDQGPQFSSPRWKQITDMVGIKLKLSGVESHNSIGSGERYHAPLRRLYNKIRFSIPNLEMQLCLRLALKAMNDTMNPEGLVPSLLVFGVLPRFPAVNTQLPNQVERMRALEVARAEMESITAELRLRKALNSNLSAAASKVYKAGDEVLVFREDEKPVKWTGPFKVLRVDDKQIFIDRKGSEVQHSVSQVKPFYRDSGEEYVETLYSMLKPLMEGEKCVASVKITETLHPADPRGMSKEFMKAKKAEIKGLIDKWT